MTVGTGTEAAGSVCEFAEGVVVAAGCVGESAIYLKEFAGFAQEAQPPIGGIAGDGLGSFERVEGGPVGQIVAGAGGAEVFVGCFFEFLPAVKQVDTESGYVSLGT